MSSAQFWSWNKSWMVVQHVDWEIWYTDTCARLQHYFVCWPVWGFICIDSCTKKLEDFETFNAVLQRGARGTAHYIITMSTHPTDALMKNISSEWVIPLDICSEQCERQDRKNCGYCHNCHNFREGKPWIFEIDGLKVNQISDEFSREFMWHSY